MSKYTIVIEDDPDDSSNVSIELIYNLGFHCDTSELSLPPETLADKIKDIVFPLVRETAMKVTGCKTIRLWSKSK